MEYMFIIDVLTAIGTIGAVIIGMAAIYYSNKTSKREIKTHKLEEIFEILQTLSRNYGKFKNLNNSIEGLRDIHKKDIQTLSDYYKIRDKEISLTERQKILSDLSRLEVLAKCYTENSLLDKLLTYEDLMYSFSELVFNGGSVHQELKWKNGFPNYDEYYSFVEELKSLIILQIREK